MNIALDLDGVLYDWHLAVYNERIVYNNEKRSWKDFWKVASNELSFSEWDYICKLPHLYEEIPPRKGVVKFVQDLAKSNSIYYITKRPSEVELVTRDYLKKYGYPNLDNLYFTDNSKRQLLIDFDIDIFVEDRIHFIEEAVDICKCFMVTQPWNEDFHDERVTRLDTFMDLKGLI